MKKIVATFALTVVAIGQLHAQSTPEAFQQQLGQLQQNAQDGALREKVIAAARSQNPAPAIPEEARRFLARGSAAFETAKSGADFGKAAEEFTKARDLAPWWEAPYFNIALANERVSAAPDASAGMQAAALKAAIANLRWYLLAAPNAVDAEAMRTKMYKLEYLAEQKGKEDEKRKKKEGWASAIVARLKTFYGEGAISEVKYCVGPISNARSGSSKCNDSEAQGSNWHKMPPQWISGGSITFSTGSNDASKVEMRVAKPTGTYTLVAQPTGANADTDIPSWSCKEGDKICEGKPVSVYFGSTGSAQTPGVWMKFDCSGDVCYRENVFLKR